MYMHTIERMLMTMGVAVCHVSTSDIRHYHRLLQSQDTSKDDLYYTGPVRDEFIMKKGDIITPLTEQAIGLLGSTAIIPEDNKYIQSQDVAKIKRL